MVKTKREARVDEVAAHMQMTHVSFSCYNSRHLILIAVVLEPVRWRASRCPALRSRRCLLPCTGTRSSSGSPRTRRTPSWRRARCPASLRKRLSATATVALRPPLPRPQTTRNRRASGGEPGAFWPWLWLLGEPRLGLPERLRTPLRWPRNPGANTVGNKNRLVWIGIREEGCLPW